MAWFHRLKDFHPQSMTFSQPSLLIQSQMATEMLFLGNSVGRGTFQDAAGRGK